MALGCITHKDLAKVRADAYQDAQQLDQMQEVGRYILSVMNQHFALVKKFKGYEAVVTRITIEKDLGGGTYEGTAHIMSFVPGKDKRPKHFDVEFTATVDKDMTRLENGGFSEDVFKR